MERPIEFYPWQMDWNTVIVIVGLGIAFALFVYLSMRQGRVERSNRDTAGKPPIHEYAGLTGTDSNRMTLFLWVFFIFIGIWALGYVINIARNGLGY